MLAYSINSANFWMLIAILIGLAMLAPAGWWFIKRYRKRLLDNDMAGGAWTLADLEKMRDSGQISAQEFRILRSQIMQGAMVFGRRNKLGESTSPGQPHDKIDDQSRPLPPRDA